MRVGAELHDSGGASTANDAGRTGHGSSVLMERAARHVIAAKTLLEGEGVEARVGFDSRERGAVSRHVIHSSLLVHGHARGAVREAGRRVVFRLVALGESADRNRYGAAQVGGSVRGIGVGRGRGGNGGHARRNGRAASSLLVSGRALNDGVDIVVAIGAVELVASHGGRRQLNHSVETVHAVEMIRNGRVQASLLVGNVGRLGRDAKGLLGRSDGLKGETAVAIVVVLGGDE